MGAHAYESPQNIKEGKKNVDSLTSAQGLICIARDTIIPKIEAFCPDFPWRNSEYVVRDSGWVDLSTYPQSEAYFYPDCISYNRKTSKPVFKSKCFPLMVVVPAAQWHEYEMFMEGREKNTSQVLARVHRGHTFQSTDFPVSPSHDDAALFLPEVSPTSSADHAPPTTASRKRGYQRTHSSDSVVTNGTQPPSKKATSQAAATHSTSQAKKATAAIIISPPCNAIRQALEKGGTANVDINLGSSLLRSLTSSLLTCCL